MKSSRTRLRRLMLPYAIIAIVIVIVALVARTLLRPSDWVLDQAAMFYPGVVFRIDTHERAIALTFDDAPHPDVTPGLLRVLRDAGAKATFFIIGSNAEAYPELVDSIRADGHELANHLYTDRMSAGLADEEFVEELVRTDALIGPTGRPKWCRPGSGFITKRLVRLMNDHGYTPCLGTAYPIDLYTPVELTAIQFMDNVRPGAILVLHDGGAGREDTIEVLAALLPRLQSRDYRLETLTDLSRLGKPVTENSDQ